MKQIAIKVNSSRFALLPVLGANFAANTRWVEFFFSGQSVNKHSSHVVWAMRSKLFSAQCVDFIIVLHEIYHLLTGTSRRAEFLSANINFIIFFQLEQKAFIKVYGSDESQSHFLPQKFLIIRSYLLYNRCWFCNLRWNVSSAKNVEEPYETLLRRCRREKVKLCLETGLLVKQRSQTRRRNRR